MVLRQQEGFTLVEMLVVLAIAAVLTGVGIGMSTTSVRMSRGEVAAAQLDGFLKRHREMALARRRDIEIEFEAPNRVRSLQRWGVGDDGNSDTPPVELETLVLEGGVEYLLFDDMTDTPNLFGNADAVCLGGGCGTQSTVMFASEGMFMDVAANPINATISLGMEGDPLTATAVTILGTTATIERWRWNGTSWTK